jgi:hypothetical protein
MPDVSSVGSKLSLTSSAGKEHGVVIVAAVLPVKVTKTGEGLYDMEWDTIRAVSKLRNPESKFKYVGWVGSDVPEQDQQAVRERLQKDFNCFPVFLDHAQAYRVFDLFCQSVLSPLFHHIIELAEEGSEACWNWDHWHEYEKVNKAYSDLALTTVAQGGPYSAGDRLWVLDYEMMLVPHYASRKNPNALIGYSFLSVFPSTEVRPCSCTRVRVRVACLPPCRSPRTLATSFLSLCAYCIPLPCTPCTHQVVLRIPCPSQPAASLALLTMLSEVRRSSACFPYGLRCSALCCARTLSRLTSSNMPGTFCIVARACLASSIAHAADLSALTTMVDA